MLLDLSMGLKNLNNIRLVEFQQCYLFTVPVSICYALVNEIVYPCIIYQALTQPGVGIRGTSHPLLKLHNFTINI